MSDLLPCPCCGNMPEVDYGFDGEPGLPSGSEFVSCSTVHIKLPNGSPDQSCGVHAQGIAEWNQRASFARNAALDEAAKVAENDGDYPEEGKVIAYAIRALAEKE